MKNKYTFTLVTLITLLLSYVALFGVHTPTMDIKGAPDMRFGIDIRGGVDAAFAPKDLGRTPTEQELESARSIIETRLDQSNILDRDVTIDKENGYIFVRFPWKAEDTEFDPEKAISELGSMAHLTFRDPDGNIVLEGKYVTNTSWGQNTEDLTGSNYIVHLSLSDEGRKMFAEATERLVGQTISIYMDETLISAPTVNQKIDDNQCVIEKISSADEARTLSNQINAGALPFSLITENYSAISPLLGSNALNVMVTAGIIAFALICLVLIFHYRLSGVVTTISLLLQVSGQLIMLVVPQITVTLPGIAGIILAIGMGVDANIIVAERIREELRSGKNITAAVTTGFKKAFSSVFDGNVTVLIVAVIMMILGSGAILSFAYTLLFGIIMNFIAGVFATRVLTTSLIQFRFAQNVSSFISKKSLAKTEVKIFPFYNKRKIFFTISAIIMVVGIVMTFINGVTLDIQFTGGSVVKYNMSETENISTSEVEGLIENILEGRVVSAQTSTDYLTGDRKLVLNLAGESLSNEEIERITGSLKENYSSQSFELAETNNVAPFFGEKFFRNGILSILISAILIIVYVWFSFRKIHGLSAGAMALVSLLHDILVVFFAFIVFRIPIGDSFIAVALTILGYSINDTIVIYDRIRENFALNKAGKNNENIDAIVDKSISQSFTRSLNTNLAVFVSVLLVFIFAAGNGLESIRTFALPMCIGTISGCYSTVCIAGPLWTMWEKRKLRGKDAKDAK